MAPDRVITVEELKQHTTDKDCWLLIEGKVYDVTEFLEEHPGGYDIILTSAGRDSTQDFEEIGHSNSARELLQKYLIGTYEGGYTPAEGKTAAKAAAAAASPSGAQRAFHVLLPLLLILAAIALNLYWGSSKQA